ncbi:TPA: MBL fold metallo-hydrolase [Haemophilus influenzae]|uniref:MBL fold metallo-hydrolase n=1 Tax=Haemophilus influenzae TaxID=727 RepID=UPI000E0D6BD9|nr:MBL fold metallo-hydrolase [Haemophilus influenzae]AXH83491.1 MBL fold metallo-hydrolase [Haemophilus influenzae]NKB31465.1 MBL fold metallo-hydrolase [Haemophilus influenzae]VTP76929.1 DNA internalization-related competence protein ComEC/Rec2 [Haemophilus influenzae]
MPILQCEFWNVGQGLFSSGRIQMGDAPSFHWVYDCGTNSSPKLIQNAIQKYNQQENNADIDLLVLSHFDKDHISGVKELLKNGRKIKRWVVPYYPLWQRLVIASLLDIQPDDEEWAFYQNPIQYFKTYFAEELKETQFLLLPAKENKSEISIILDPSNFDDVLSFETTKKLSDEFDNNVHWLNPNKALLFRKGEAQFEFVLYNVPFHLLAKVPTNLTAFQKQVKQIIQSHQSNSTDPTPALKTLYTLAFGNGNKNKNIISQYLYIRNIKLPSFWGMGNNHIFDVSTDNENEIAVIPKDKTKNAILYTGDAFLNDLPLLTDLTQSLGAERMARIYCLQVPHHGSKHNWQQGLAKILSPCISVFSADSQRRKGHPHGEVLKDFAIYTSILVNKTKRLSIHSI